MTTKRIAELPAPVVTVRGEFGDGTVELVTGKLAPVARHARGRVLSMRVELSRHPDPAVALPVTAKVVIDVNGTPVQAEATARTARDAVHRMVDRLIRRLDER